MRFHGMLVAAVALMAATTAEAVVRIDGDQGGRIDQYLSRFAALRSSGERVVVDGPCNSACTLLLGALPRERICVTGRASLGFHAAWQFDERGQPVSSRPWTTVLWRTYPRSIRHWISRHGGLTSRMIYLRGAELDGLYPRCAPETGFQAGR